MPDIKGDIKALYKYYRLSDHESTCLTLKDKVLVEEPVWFEGYMDFSFKCCTFDQPIYWGVEGTRLEGDTRGTDENDDTFPIYGSNGLNFDGCTFTPNAPLTIEANCVAVLINCTFIDQSVITLGNNTRVEFIDCTFNKWRIDISDFCDVRMRRCTWTSPPYHIKITNGSQLTCNDCEYNSAGQYSMSISGDSKVRLTNHEPVDVSAGQYLYEVSDKSSLDMYNFGTLNAGKQVLIVEDSKVKWRTISIANAADNAIELYDDSLLFCKDVDEVISVLTAIVMDNSTLRMKNNSLIEGIIHGIKATESKVIIQDYGTIKGIQADACWGDRTDFRVFNGEEIVNEANGAGIFLTGESKSLFKDLSIRIKGLFYGLDIHDKAEITVESCPLIRGEIKYGIIYDSDPIIACIGVDTIKGLIHGIIGDTATLRITNTITEIYGETEHGMIITNTLYDFKNIDYIHGLLKGAILNNCKGVVQELREIQGETEEGCVINGMAGPTEWINVDLIWSPIMQGLIFTGDAAQSRFSGVKDIHSETLEGVIWTQSGGIAVFSNFGEIYSIPESGLEVHISDGAILEMDIGEKIYSIDKHAIEGDNAGIFVCTNIQEISSQNGDIVKLTGSGVDSTTKFRMIQTMSTQQAPDDAIKIAGNGLVVLQDIDTITAQEAAQYVVNLESISVGYGNIRVLNCKEITSTKARGGLYVKNALLADVVGIDEACKITVDEAEVLVFGAANTGLFLKNYDEISCSDGEARAIYLYNLSLPACEQRVQNVKTVKAKKGPGFEAQNKGQVFVVDVERIETQGDDNAAFFGQGEGKFFFHGSPITIAGKAEDKKALEIQGGNIPCWLDMNNVTIEKGQTVFDKVAFRMRGCTLKDMEWTEAGGEAYGTTFDTKETVEFTESSLYMFKSEFVGLADAIFTDSTITFDVSTLDHEGAFGGALSSTLIGDTSYFSSPEITGFKAIHMNGCMGDSDIDSQGVVINGCSFTGKIFCSGFYARSGLIINGSYIADVEATQDGAVILNGTQSLEALTIGDENALMLNRAYFSKATEIGDGNAITCNYGVLRDLTIGNGNILLANRTTVNAVVAGDQNVISFNYCIPTSAGITVGNSCLLELNATSAPQVPIVLGDDCAFLGATLAVDSISIPRTSAALLANATANSVGIAGDMVCSGAAFLSAGGKGRMIATSKDTLHVLGSSTSAGVVAQNEDDLAQSVLFSEKTYFMAGSNVYDCVGYAPEGTAYLRGYVARIRNLNGSNVVQTTGDTIRMEANAGNIYIAADNGDQIRTADGVISDEAASITHDPPV